MKPTIPLLVLLVAASAPAGMDFDLSQFRPFPETEIALTPQGLKVTTSSALAGGVEQCIELQRPLGKFGATVTVPDTNDRGQPNRGTAALAVFLFDAPGCAGPASDPIPAQPIVRADTPRNTPISMRGEVMLAINPARSAALALISSAEIGGVLFTVSLSEAFYRHADASGPDLTPYGEVEGIVTPTGVVPIALIPVVREGQTVKVRLGALNIGSRATTGPWSVTLEVNPLDWGADPQYQGCTVGAAIPYQSSAPVPSGGSSGDLCVYLRARRGANESHFKVVVAGGGDINPTNNEAEMGDLTILSPRDAGQIDPLPLLSLEGRYRVP